MPTTRPSSHLKTDAPKGKVSGPASPADPDAPSAAIVAPVAAIDRHMARCIDAAPLPDSLADAIRYSLLGPGKRLRPLLVWHAAVAVGATGEVALPSAAALEMVHAFSLVHDDLPGIDNDDLRRGRPTLHRHTSEAMAILAGDAMLTLSFQVLVEQVSDPSLSAALVRELTVATNAMIAGQVFDTLAGFPPRSTAGKPLDDAARLKLVHQNKTGALIRASCRMGAMTGIAARQSEARNPDSEIEALTRYGDAIGLMFQIVDDVLDETQTTDHLGKRSGKDREAGKLTYPGVLGIRESRAEVIRLRDIGLASLAPLGPEAEPLREIASYLAVRSR